jgi:hypothetical protein
MPDKTTTAGKIAAKLNWKIVLALSASLAAAVVGSAVYGCDLVLGISGISLTCEDK